MNPLAQIAAEATMLEVEAEMFDRAAAQMRGHAARSRAAAMRLWKIAGDIDRTRLRDLMGYAKLAVQEQQSGQVIGERISAVLKQMERKPRK